MNEFETRCAVVYERRIYREVGNEEDNKRVPRLVDVEHFHGVPVCVSAECNQLEQGEDTTGICEGEDEIPRDADDMGR